MITVVQQTKKDGKKISLIHNLHHLRVRWLGYKKANKITLNQKFSSFFIKIHSFSAVTQMWKFVVFCSGSQAGWILIHYANDSSVFHFQGCQLHSLTLCKGNHHSCWASQGKSNRVWNVFSSKMTTTQFYGMTESSCKVTVSLSNSFEIEAKGLTNFIEREASRQILPWNIPDLGFAEHLFNTDAKPLRF